MLLIAHRGNLHGPNSLRENTLDYIKEAIDAGFLVEVDVFKVDSKIYLGHELNMTDSNEISEVELRKLKKVAWFHAKNKDALDYLMLNGFHCFWHDKDAFTFTNRGFLWSHCYFALESDYGIICLPELMGITKEFIVEQLLNCRGVCSDYISHYK